jgi:dTDP-4-dehydrorhamnose reductase
VLRANPRAELVALADPLPEAQALDIAGYDNVEAMLDAVQPQGVINATPNLLHVPCALAIPQMQCWRYAKRAAGQAANPHPQAPAQSALRRLFSALACEEKKNKFHLKIK